MSVSFKAFSAYSRPLSLIHRAAILQSRFCANQYHNSALFILKRCLSSVEKSAENAPTNEATETASREQSPSTTELKLMQQVDSISKELETLKQSHDDLMNKYKRALAESENLRVRLTKQIADAKIFGIQTFCKDMLEVADILGHATQAVPKDELNDDNPHLKNLYDGLIMTKASLFQVFRRHGLEPLDPINEKFDPNFHEALFQTEDPNSAPNTVISVTKLGYKLHERCIRPALVGVSKAP